MNALSDGLQMGIWLAQTLSGAGGEERGATLAGQLVHVLGSD